MFGGGSLFSSTSQAPTSLLGSASTGLFSSPFTSTAANTSGGLFGTSASTSQSLGGSSLFGSSSWSTGITQGQKGTVGVKLALIYDNNEKTLPFASILAMNELTNQGKSLEELRLEDYQLKKAGQVTFKKNQTSGIIGNTGTSLFASSTGTQASGGLFSNTPTSSGTGRLFDANTGLFTSSVSTSSIGLPAASQKPTGLFGSLTSTPLFSGTPNTGTGIADGSFGSTQNTIGTINTVQTSTAGTLFGNTAKLGVQPVNTPSFPTDNSSLFAPIQSTYTDPYYIKSYFTGKKELEQSISNRNSLITPYDNTGEILRRDYNLTNDWELKSKVLFQDDEGSSIARRLQSTKETIAQSIEKLGILRIPDNSAKATMSWNIEDEEIIGVDVECVVKKKRVKMHLRVHNSRLVDELKELSLKKINTALKLNIKKEDCKLIKGKTQLRDRDRIQDANINNDDKLKLTVDYSDKSYDTRSNRTISITSEQFHTGKIPEEIKQEVKKHNKLLSKDVLKPSRGEEELSVKEDVEYKKKADKKLLPKLKNKDYRITPDIAILRNMTEEQLMSIPNFAIENKHGKIIFEGNTNVIGLDLDKIVRIEERKVIVYSEDTEIPVIGKGLNKPATVYLYKCFIGVKNKYDIPKRLKKVAKKQNAIHVDYDEDNGTWIFRVNHF